MTKHHRDDSGARSDGSGMTRATAGWHLVAVLVLLWAPALLAQADVLPGAAAALVGLLSLPLAAGLAVWLARSHGGMAALGLGRPESWPRTFGLGVGVGVGMLLVIAGIIEPGVGYLTGQSMDMAPFEAMVGDLPRLVINVVLISWLHAALCEEIVFRGFFISWTETLLGPHVAATAVGIVLQATLFGLAHAGSLHRVLATLIGGLVWGLLFVLLRRRLWALIVAHGTLNSIVFTLVYFGKHELLF